MTPYDVFMHELKQAGYAMCVVSGGYEVCGCDGQDRVIRMGDRIPDFEFGIIGLHELGHQLGLMPGKMTFVQRMFNAAMADAIEPMIPNSNLVYKLRGYDEELAAWAWAESKMPDGYDDEFQCIRAWALQTYLTGGRLTM